MAHLLPVVNTEVANNGEDGDQQEQREEVPGAISGGGVRLGLLRGNAVYLTQHRCKGRHVV